MSKETGALAQIHRQIMWNRLISVVEEQAQTMIRTAFSTTVREAGDLSAGIFDMHGRMMAQAVTGTLPPSRRSRAPANQAKTSSRRNPRSGSSKSWRRVRPATRAVRGITAAPLRGMPAAVSCSWASRA